MAIAKSQLGVECFMAAEGLAQEKPDKFSVMLYLTQFCKYGQHALLLWIQKQISDETVTDFSDSWTSGKALGALTNAVSGGKFPSYIDMIVDNAIVNIEQAMVVAEELLRVRRIITHVFFSEVPHILFRLGYLAQFQRAKKSEGTLLPLLATADLVEVSDLQIPNKIEEGKCAWVELNCFDAGHGRVTAEVQGKTEAVSLLL